MTQPNPTIDIAKARADWDNAQNQSVLWADRALWFETYAESLLTALEQMQARIDDIRHAVQSHDDGEFYPGQPEHVLSVISGIVIGALDKDTPHAD